MAIRQIRHLQEVPGDFFRLPIFIIVSTFFLMPVRLLGFLRMAHASGWGTRAGAYAGGDPGQGGAEENPQPGTLEAELGLIADTAPVDVVDRGGFPTQRDHATDPGGAYGEPVHAVAGHAPLEAGAAASAPAPAAAPAARTAVATVAAPESSRRHARAAAPAPARRRLNPLAAIPYVIAVVLFALEALLYV
jgi:hyaluronan synthase